MTFSLPLTPYVSFSIPSNPATPIHPAPYNFFDYLTFPPVLSYCTTFLQKPSGHKNPSPGWASCSCFAPTASSVYLCPERAPLLWILFVHLSLPLDWESSLRVRQHRIHLSSPRACSVLMYKILSMQISASVLSLVKATSNLFGNLSYTNCLCLSRFSCVWLLVTLWTVAHQAPLSKGFTKDLPLEWIAISSSRGSSWPRDRIHISYVSCIGRWVPTTGSTSFAQSPSSWYWICLLFCFVFAGKPSIHFLGFPNWVTETTKICFLMVLWD